VPRARTKDQLSLVLIVAPAAERDVLGGGGASQCVGPDVMELQEGALGAPASLSTVHFGWPLPVTPQLTDLLASASTLMQ